MIFDTANIMITVIGTIITLLSIIVTILSPFIDFDVLKKKLEKKEKSAEKIMQTTMQNSKVQTTCMTYIYYVKNESTSPPTMPTPQDEISTTHASSINQDGLNGLEITVKWDNKK